jgi:hypothetical protein
MLLDLDEFPLLSDPEGYFGSIELPSIKTKKLFNPSRYTNICIIYNIIKNFIFMFKVKHKIYIIKTYY